MFRPHIAELLRQSARNWSIVDVQKKNTKDMINKINIFYSIDAWPE